MYPRPGGSNEATVALRAAVAAERLWQQTGACATGGAAIRTPPPPCSPRTEHHGWNTQERMEVTPSPAVRRYHPIFSRPYGGCVVVLKM